MSASEDDDDDARSPLRLAGVPSPSHLAALTELDLPGRGLDALPSCLPEATPNLSILFAPDNRFAELPEIVGRCANLQMVSFKNNGMTSIHPDALRPQMRWLILTGNGIKKLPSTIGRCTKLQKLMLSGNDLEELPDEIENCRNLELVRLACNKLKEPPMKLLSLPNLCWAAFSNNPFLESVSVSPNLNGAESELKIIDDPSLDGADWPILGRGAGGVTRQAKWNGSPVAVKTYSGELTSDGSPQDERAINVVAATLSHDCLIRLIGQTPTGALIMEFLDGYSALAGPPSMESCSRDVYPESRSGISWEETKTILSGLLDAMKQLHSKSICHGDFYGHNILVADKPKSGASEAPESIVTADRPVKLSDFGAAYFYDKSAPYAALVESIEVRAFGVLVGEFESHAYKLDGLAATCREAGAMFERVSAHAETVLV